MSRSDQFMAAMRAFDEDRHQEALRLMEDCAELGDPVACYLAALWNRSAEGHPADLQRSAHWLRRLETLADGGNAEAQWELGQHYRFADLLPSNVERANHWLETAAHSGHGEAQHHLAWYLATGQYNYPVDMDGSEARYRRAFEQGHPETLYVFALREFKNGKITPAAIALLKEAADKGFKQAEHMLSAYTNR